MTELHSLTHRHTHTHTDVAVMSSHPEDTGVAKNTTRHSTLLLPLHPPSSFFPTYSRFSWLSCYTCSHAEQCVVQAELQKLTSSLSVFSSLHPSPLCHLELSRPPRCSQPTAAFGQGLRFDFAGDYLLVCVCAHVYMCVYSLPHLHITLPFFLPFFRSLSL